MTQVGQNLHVCVAANLAALGARDQQAWDACAGEGNPFVRYGFLARLERTGCATPARGWTPRHLLVRREGELVAAMPLYEKTHSYGEFVFDWAWADAAERHGLAYYPKLVAAVPFTPAAGPRVLLRPGVALDDVLPALVAALDALATQLGCSGVHVLFAQRHEALALAAHGFAPRLGYQFHFARAPGWRDYDAWLAALRASSRKQVRRERARAQAHGLRLSFRPAEACAPADLLAMHNFYRSTVDEKGAHAYLTPAFFTDLAEAAPASTYLAMAHDGERPVAGALYFRARNRLYGRYWGAYADYDCLHFELCYYAPIAFALAHGIDHFEAGAQGPHKIKRGLLPAACHSAHRLRHPGLHAAVARFCGEEAQGVAQQMEALQAHSPYAAGRAAHAS